MDSGTRGKRTLRPLIALIALTAVLLAPTVTDSPTAQAQPGTSFAELPDAGVYVPLSPARILDTRNGLGRNGVTTPLGPKSKLDLTVTGRGGVPQQGVAAAALNVTVIGATGSSFLTVWPAGGARPNASNLNFVADQVVANMVIARLSQTGAVSIYNDVGTVDVIVDVVGYYENGLLLENTFEGSGYVSLPPARILDTRNAIGGPPARLGPGDVRTLKVVDVGGVFDPAATAVALNVTAVEPTGASFLTVYPSGESRPNASNVNFPPGRNVPNMVIAKVGASGQVNIYNDVGFVDVIVDVVGFYSTSTPWGQQNSLTPARVFDTRNTIGGPAVALSPKGSVNVQVTGKGGVPEVGVDSVVLNVTGVAPTGKTFLTVYPTGAPRPNASNLNIEPGQNVPNLVIAKVGSGGMVTVYNDVGTTDVIIDVVGYYTSLNPPPHGRAFDFASDLVRQRRAPLGSPAESGVEGSRYPASPSTATEPIAPTRSATSSQPTPSTSNKEDTTPLYGQGLTLQSAPPDVGLLLQYSWVAGDTSTLTVVSACTASAIARNLVLSSYSCVTEPYPAGHSFAGWEFLPAVDGPIGPTNLVFSTLNLGWVLDVDDTSPAADYILVEFEPNPFSSPGTENQYVGDVVGFHDILVDPLGGPRLTPMLSCTAVGGASGTPNCTPDVCYSPVLSYSEYNRDYATLPLTTGMLDCSTEATGAGAPSYEYIGTLGGWFVAGVARASEPGSTLSETPVIDGLMVDLLLLANAEYP